MTSTVLASIALASLIVEKKICSDLNSGLITRLMEWAAASALKGSPLWNWTPGAGLTAR
jgi:hypothetical protein